MNRTSADLLLAGKAEIRAIGEPCDPSCAMWFACANSTPNGTCKGFVPLNGKSKDILRKNMREDDLIYLENATRTVQNGCTPETKEALTNEIYRYLKPINNILREEPAIGFRAMLDSAIRPTPESTPEQPSTRTFTGGFLGILQEASKGSDLESSSSVITRNFGFGQSQKPIRRIPLGFRAMIDELSGTDEQENAQVRSFVKPPRNQHKAIPLGFRGMIDALSGENEEDEEPQPIIRSCGFKGMLEDAFERESTPISFERQLRAILNAR